MNADKEVLVLEKTDRLGGCIESQCYDGIILEYGTHTLYRSYTSCYDLLSERFRSTHCFPSPKFRYFVDDKGSLTAFWRQFSLWSLFSLLKVLFVPREDRTLSSYFVSVFGQKTYENLFNPAFDALYCQPSAYYPLALLFKKRVRNRLKEMPKAFCYQGGMEAVIGDIASSVDYRLNQTITAVKYDGHYYLLYTNEQAMEPAYTCKTLAIATTATEAMRLLSGVDITDDLPIIVPAKFASMSLVYQSKNYLPDSGLIGWKNALFSAIFARRPPGVVSDYQGVTCHYRNSDISDEDALNIACRVLKIDRSAIISWSRKQNQVPALRVHHLAEIRMLSETLPSTLALLGNYFGGFSIEDCVRRSQEEFHRMFAV